MRVITDQRELDRVLDRFAHHTAYDPTTGCMNWTGALKAPDRYDPVGGYSRFSFDGKSVSGHVWVMTQYLGRIINSRREDTHHTCWNRACVNPHHLVVLRKRDHQRIEMTRRIANRLSGSSRSSRGVAA